MAQLDGHTLLSPPEAAAHALALLPTPTLPAQVMVSALTQELYSFTGLGDWLVTLSPGDDDVVTLRLIQPGTVNHGIEVTAWIDTDSGETYFYWES